MIKPQTIEQAEKIKTFVRKEYTYPIEIRSMMDLVTLGSKLKKDTIEYKVTEIQLKGILAIVDDKRRYISYQIIDEYEVV